MIAAKVSKITNSDEISLVYFDADGLILQMISLEVLNLKAGQSVKVGAKSSDLILSKTRLQDCSISNELSCKITSVNVGELLSVINLKCGSSALESIITTNSALRLGLKTGDEIFCYIKATSLFISGEE